MTDVINTRAIALRRADAATKQARRLPVGYGLALGASASLGLWGMIAWAVFHALS
jgi:hypothetical protein